LTPVLVLTPVLFATLTIAYIIRIVLKLHGNCKRDEITPEWLAGFSVSTYQPMQELFHQDDFAFLSRQPGFDLVLYKKFRRERLRIFRQYMNRLIADYNRLHTAARFLVSQTGQDRSEMMTRLILQKLNFAAAVFSAEVNYVLCCVGFRTLAARSLIVRLEQLNTQVAFISAARVA